MKIATATICLLVATTGLPWCALAQSPSTRSQAVRPPVGHQWQSRSAQTRVIPVHRDLRRRAPARQFRAIPPYPATIRPVVPSQMNVPAVDLRPLIAAKGLGIRSQGSRGTCSVFAITFCLEFVSPFTGDSTSATYG